VVPFSVAAQDEEGTRRRGAAGTLIEEIVVRAQKKGEAEQLQEVPLTVTAFSGEQLDALQYRNIESLTFAMPNVSLDSVGTAKGVANFAIRGLGINSSIPSIDPTVGVFTDGMYLGVNYGVVVDSFDLESVEVLRGPQGLLFGRNVTGGAVLLRSRRPGDELSAEFRTYIEEGIEYGVAASVDLPLLPEILYSRFAINYRDDDGWYTNEFNSNSDFGQEDTLLLKPSLRFTPIDELEMTLIYEHGDTDADGPAAQNRTFYGPTSESGSELRGAFDFAIDEEGFADIKWNSLVLDTNWDIGFGDGTITDIFGWRDLRHNSLSDIDAQPVHLFHAQAKTDQWQVSNELRYAGTFFDIWQITTGFYYFHQEIEYRERRLILGAIDTTLGGDQDQDTIGLFTQSDVEILPELHLIAGLRYTWEQKDVKIATFNVADSPCGVLKKNCDFDFRDDDSWDNVTPKLGLQWWPYEDIQWYGFFTMGFRSGGYNFRNTSPEFDPGPFREETQYSGESGVKSTFLDGRARVNFAAFYNWIEDLQRELNEPDPLAGVVQIVRNTADAQVFGFELETIGQITDEFVVTGSIGYTEGRYDKVKFDLNGDGVVNGKDRNLDLPRLTKWSFNLGAVYDYELFDSGILTLGQNYAYRDDSFFTDNNRGTLPDGHILDTSLSLTLFDFFSLKETDPRLTITFYAKNWLNEGFRGGDTILPPTIVGVPAGGTFSPLKEGRVIGGEIRLSL
jgi:iron complex outermembrane receptor protein